MVELKAAILERERRSTAGTRMTKLIGQAVEDDESFWNHSTWSEGTRDGDHSSEDESFHESDEDDEHQVDTFDSDFNDSEDEEDEQNEGTEEESLVREERREKSELKSKRGYQEPGRSKKNFELASAAEKDFIQKRKTSIQKKRALRGDGMNAGLILNAPGTIPPRPVKCVASTTQPAVQKQKVVILEPRRSTRSRQSKFEVVDVMRRSLRASTLVNSIQQSERDSVIGSNVKKVKVREKRKNKFSQEELLLEAVQETEGKNERWLLNRKRLQEDEQNRSEIKSKMNSLESGAKKKTIHKYNSKRGCFNTFTFPEMDHIPDLFSQPKWSDSERESNLKRLRQDRKCVITGKIARYRDPETNRGYYDVEAFKELRRRYDSNMCLDTQLGSQNANTKETNPLPASLSNIACLGASNPSTHQIQGLGDVEFMQEKR